MSVKSSKSTLKEVPGITSGVESLQELGMRMRGEEFGFNEDDVENIDHVIEALQEAHCECLSLHEKLETETIKASVLRHKLQFYPGEINAEIKAAVDAARQSNAEEIDSLQQQLKDIIENTAYLEMRHQELEKENSVLHPKRDKVREEHDDIIAQLNQRMAEKAGKQIILNETRDRVRTTNQKIVDLEEGVLQLREDLIQERADARMERKRLKKFTYDTTVKCKEQKEVNVEKKKEVDGLHELVMDSEGQLSNIKKTIKRYETSRCQLHAQTEALTANYDKEAKENKELQRDGQKLNRQLAEEQRIFEGKRAALEARIVELDGGLAAEQVKKKELELQKAELEQDLKVKMKVRKEDEQKVKDRNQSLQRAKQNLAFKAEESARLVVENTDIEKRIMELGQTHEAIKTTLQKQIYDYRQVLAKERQQRMELQSTREAGQKEMDEYRVQAQRYFNEKNRHITEGKQKHDTLTKEGTSLQRALREDEATINQLNTTLREQTLEFQRMKASMETAIETLKSKIANMESAVADKTRAVENRLPLFHELEEAFQDRTDSYQETKKSIAALKNKKLSLEESTRRCQSDLEKMAKPQADLKRDLQKKRKALFDQLQKRGEEMREIERNIYTVGCKLKTAMEENARFTESIEELEAAIQDLQQQGLETDQVTAKLSLDFTHMKGSLEEDWATDRRLQQEYAARDEGLVQGMGLLLKMAEQRDNTIGNITRKLESELKVLTLFLDDVARRRPRESRQSNKPGTPHMQSGISTARATVKSTAPPV